MDLTGLHHLTAVTGRAAQNLAFYTETLGLRLVKKTVNQDDVSAYHLFYADETGSPGTDVTFFDWAWASPARAGTETVSETALRVPTGALAWWQERLREVGVTPAEIADHRGRPSLAFTDPEGQHLRLVEDGAPPAGVPWSGSSVPASAQIRGLHDVTLQVAALAPTLQVLTEVMGFRPIEERAVDGGQLVVLETGAGGPGTEVRVVATPAAPRGRVGIGGVHHVAFRVPDDAAHEEWQGRIAAAGLGVTPIIDRFYFRSIYFREPGGVLFEIATDGPGFTADEPAAELGQHLALPPFLEPRRAEIEANLRPLPAVAVATSARRVAG